VNGADSPAHPDPTPAFSGRGSRNRRRRGTPGRGVEEANSGSVNPAGPRRGCAWLPPGLNSDGVPGDVGGEGDRSAGLCLTQWETVHMVLAEAKAAGICRPLSYSRGDGTGRAGRPPPGVVVAVRQRNLPPEHFRKGENVSHIVTVQTRA